MGLLWSHTAWQHSSNALLSIALMGTPPSSSSIPTTWIWPTLCHIVSGCYVCAQAQEAGCRVHESEAQNAPEQGTRSITFLTKQELRAAELTELPLAEVALVRPATPPGALPALHPPSKVCWLHDNCTIIFDVLVYAPHLQLLWSYGMLTLWTLTVVANSTSICCCVLLICSFFVGPAMAGDTFLNV